MRAAPTDRSSFLTAAIMAGALAYSWIAAALRPFTWPEDLAVAIPVLVVGVFVGRRWAEPRTARASDPGGARARHAAGAVWIGLFSLLMAWELAAYFSSPRHDHPTLSSIADDIMSSHPGRAAMFGLWLALGWLLFARSPHGQRGLR
jgi:hypothetical protein